MSNRKRLFISLKLQINLSILYMPDNSGSYIQYIVYGPWAMQAYSTFHIHMHKFVPSSIYSSYLSISNEDISTKIQSNFIF